MTSAVASRVSVDTAPGRRREPVAPWEVVAVVLAMVTVAVIGAIALSRDAPLLWDEAVYSLRVRDLVGGGVRGLYWIEVRAPGLPLLLSPVGLLFGVAEEPLRATSLLLAVAGVLLTWFIARLTIGTVPAVLAAWLLAMAPGWNESSWQVMPDIPGAVLTLGAFTAVLAASQGDRVSWWALAAAPLAGAATLVRYGAPLLIGPTMLAAFLLRWKTVRASRLRSFVVLTSTAAAAAVVWFVPAVTGSSRSPVVIYSGRQDDKAIPGLTSAADFLSRLLELVGPVFGLLVVIGGVLAVVAAVRRRAPRGPVIVCALIALSVLTLMLFGIAEYNVRYLTPSLPFLAMLVAVGLAHAAKSVTPRAAVALGAAVGVVGVGVAADAALDRSAELHRLFGPVRGAYQDIARISDPPCVVLDHNPTAEWHTRCAGLGPSALGGLVDRRMPAADVGPEERVFVVVRHWENVGNPGPDDRELLEEISLRDISTARTVTVLDLGTVRSFTAEMAARGLADGP